MLARKGLEVLSLREPLQSGARVAVLYGLKLKKEKKKLPMKPVRWRNASYGKFIRNKKRIFLKQKSMSNIPSNILRPHSRMVKNIHGLYCLWLETKKKRKNNKNKARTKNGVLTRSCTDYQTRRLHCNSLFLTNYLFSWLLEVELCYGGS